MLKWMKRLGFVTFALTLSGCAPGLPPSGEKVANLPTFEYRPPSSSPVDSGSVAFALVNPQFPDAWKSALTVHPYNTFAKNMAADFEEIVTARGYRLRGPFRTYDELTFPDKENTDLIMTPKIDVDLNGLGQTVSNTDLLGTAFYRWKGTVTIGGRITITLNESLSNERMWTKSIELPAKSIPYESRKQSVPVTWGGIPDTELSTIIAEALQEYYTLTMEKVWLYLDPKEMALVKQQTQTLKEKKRY